MIRPDGPFLPLFVAFADAEASPAVLETLKSFIKIDLKGVKRFDYRWGLDGDALRDEFRIVSPSPRTGVLTIFDQPTFDARSFPPLPPGVSNFTIIAVDPGRFYGQIEALLTAASPNVAPTFRAMESAVKDATGLRLREDVLAKLGTRMTFYTSPVKKGLSFGLPAVGVQVPKGALLLEMKDAEGVGKMLDVLLPMANKEMAKRMASFFPPPAQNAGDAKKAAPAATLEFKVTGEKPKTWSLILPNQWAALTNLPRRSRSARIT